MTHFKIQSLSSGHSSENIKFEYMTCYIYISFHVTLNQEFVFTISNAKYRLLGLFSCSPDQNIKIKIFFIDI